MTKHIRTLLGVALLLLAASAGAETVDVGQRLEAFELEDQHGQTGRIDASVKRIVFGRDMGAGDVSKEALDGVSVETLAERQLVYVADISRMPGLVARWFAIPSMRKRPYPMLLDHDGDATAMLPSQEDQVTVLTLEALEITGVDFVSTPDELRTLLELPQKE